MVEWKSGCSLYIRRLDRCMENQDLQNLFPNLEVEHLIKQGSYHSPLVISIRTETRPIQKAFRVLNFLGGT